MSNEKETKKIIKHTARKFPPIIAKKDVIQCMYCQHYNTYKKECHLYTDSYPVKRKPHDFCSYGAIDTLWLRKMGYTQAEIESIQNIQKSIETQAEDILKEILK